MRYHRYVVPFLILASVLAGCAQLPPNQFSFDLTGQPMPVMLTPVDGHHGRTVKFDAGYSTDTSSHGGGPNGNSVQDTKAELVKAPLPEQVKSALDPALSWAQVKELSFHAYEWFWGIGYWSDEAKYTLNLALDVPTGGVKK